MARHDCIRCEGIGKLDYYISYETGVDTYIEDGKLHDCWECSGEGTVDYCQCCAYEPFECICGAWDDVDLDDWYGDDNGPN